MELAKAYDPKQVEERIYAFWEQHGYFKPENQVYLNPEEKPFVITIPPPNVTGTLHMGHALTMATEDLMTRYHRMKGARTLWVPGTDHAGIATQAVVEKKLEKEGKRRREMGRSAFLEEVWEFKEYSHRVITHQSKKLGISVDWAREVFTLDDNLSHAVRTAFKHLYDKGLIYRDTRMVNWDPAQLTGVSDLEAITEDEGEAGHLWYIQYPIQTNHWEGPQAGNEWGSGQWAVGATRFITIATTRPETLLGDTAVMVNPDDERYTDLIGCRAILPVLGRWTPIIGDDAVDKGFGPEDRARAARLGKHPGEHDCYSAIGFGHDEGGRRGRQPRRIAAREQACGGAGAGQIGGVAGVVEEGERLRSRLVERRDLVDDPAAVRRRREGRSGPAGDLGDGRCKGARKEDWRCHAAGSPWNSNGDAACRRSESRRPASPPRPIRTRCRPRSGRPASRRICPWWSRRHNRTGSVRAVRPIGCWRRLMTG